MTELVWCPVCKREVMPTKKMNWTLFLIGIIFLGIITLVAIIEYILKKPTICPICGYDLHKQRNVKEKSD